DRSRSCVAALLVMVVVNRALIGCPVPKDLSRISIHAYDFEGVFAITAYGVGMLELFAFINMFHCLLAGDYCSFNCSSQEDPIAPDDGRRMAAPGQRRFPLNVFGIAPLKWKALFFGDTLSFGAAPLRPVRSLRSL